jgi:Tol biopolymer transport system component
LSTAALASLSAALADRYRIERELGAGGMAVVYLAHDLRHDRKVAIKVLRPELSAALGEERFLREITTTAGLRHPHILPLYDSGAAAGSLFYVMPWVEGETIEDRLRREKQLPLFDALRIAREVADALHYAHERGIVHRDIKPANIMFESGHAVVADFGIARAVQAAGGTQLTQAGFSIGTPSYMSPEQAAGEQRIDGRSDLYSLGCVLYEMLAGAPPYTGTTAAAVVSQHLSAPAPSVSAARSGIPATVDVIVTRLLAKDPAERYARATELIAALDRALTPSATPTAERPAEARPRSRHRALAGIGVVLALLTLGLLLRQRGSSSPGPPPFTFRQVTFSAEVEEFPALSSDGSRLVFSRDVGGVRQLFLVDVATGTESRITRDSSDNIQATWTPDGKSILFVRGRQPRIRLEPGDKFGLYFGGDIWRRDLESGAEERLIEDAYDPSVAEDGRLVFDATRAGTRRIWISDSAGRNAQQLSQDSSETVSHLVPRWSPDGRQVVFQTIERTRFDIRIIDVETRVSRAVTSDGYADVEPAWDPSGRAIWYTSNRAGGYNIWRLAIQANGSPDGLPVQMTTGAGEDVQVAVAERGGRLAFTVLHLNADLWRLPVDPATGKPTGIPEPLVVTTREDSRGAWSPDGSRIAFNSDRGGNMNIYVRTLADGSDRQLTTGAGGDYQPRWSPDGTRIVFFSARSGNNDIWSVDVASGALTRLTTNPSLDIDPAFSPDGATIAYHSDQGGRLDLWLMNADGSSPRRLSRGGVAVVHFNLWSLDGKYLYLRDGNADATPGRIAVADGSMETMSFRGGSHMSFNPEGTVISDVVRHRWLWASPLGGTPDSTFAFDDPAVRVDYPVWSPDGRWILFDRSKPEGGDIWLMEPSK